MLKHHLMFQIVLIHHYSNEILKTALTIVVRINTINKWKKRMKFYKIFQLYVINDQYNHLLSTTFNTDPNACSLVHTIRVTEFSLIGIELFVFFRIDTQVKKKEKKGKKMNFN